MGTKINALPQVVTPVGTDELPISQDTGSGSRITYKATLDQIKNYVKNTGGGTGSVTSVGVNSTDGSISVFGSPVVGAGTITLNISSVGLDKLDDGGATNGQILTYNGSTTTWVASAVPKELPSTATTGQVLTYNGSTTTWVASAAPAPATSSNAFAAKAWVNFDGTTTPPSIRSAFNVSSVTRNNTGDFTINFTNPMVDANYCFAVGSASVGGGGFITQNMVSQTVNNINFTLLYSSSITLGNSTVVSLIIFGN